MTSRMRTVGAISVKRCALVLFGSCVLGLGAFQLAPAGAATARSPEFQSPRWNTPTTTCTKPPTSTTAAPTTTEVATTSAPTTTVPETTTSLRAQASTTVAPTSITVSPTTVTFVHQGTQAPPTTKAALPATLPTTGSNTTPPLIFGLSALVAGALLLARRRPARWTEQG
jgi:LPXTG-motif cell wall-anchored protein